MAVKRFSTSFISESGQDKSSNFIAGYSPAIDEMDLIQRVTVGAGGAANINFTSIPQTYQHLQIRLIARQTNTSVGAAWASVQLNSDTTNNYNYHALWGDGASAISDTTGTANTMYPLRIASSSQNANVFGVGVADILDYANTSKTTVLRGFTGYDNNGSGVVYVNSNLWLSTAAVNSITMTPRSGNFAEFTVASLYGVIG